MGISLTSSWTHRCADPPRLSNPTAVLSYAAMPLDIPCESFGENHGAPARIDVKSYFMHMEDYPSWEHAKTLYDVLRNSGKYIRMTVYGPWEATWRHRGYEQLFMDLALDPDRVLEMAETQVSLVETCPRHCLSLGIRPDALFLVEVWRAGRERCSRRRCGVLSSSR